MYISPHPYLSFVLEGIMIFFSASLFRSTSNLVPPTLSKMTNWVLEIPFKVQSQGTHEVDGYIARFPTGTLHPSQHDLWSTNTNNIVAIIVEETTNNLSWDKPQPVHSYVKNLVIYGQQEVCTFYWRKGLEFVFTGLKGS